METGEREIDTGRFRREMGSTALPLWMQWVCGGVGVIVVRVATDDSQHSVL
jgi:hypothetical protein